MPAKLIASYRRKLSALADLQERVGMLTRFLYENAVEPAQVPAVLYDLCGSAVG